MSKPLNVLILDDNPADVELMLIELRKSGFEPSWQLVDNEKDFIAHLKPTLDVILSDYSLPKFTGLQALALRDESGFDIPFILVSSTMDEELAMNYMEKGAADYLMKDRIARLGPAIVNAIKNARLINEAQRTAGRLAVAYDATIEVWSRALDLRDKEAEGHSQRVTEMTIRLARRMGVNESEIEHMRRGALLHDVGNMGIPDSILLKPGQLTEKEWELMCRHPDFGYELLSSVAFLLPALDIPYCHHEKWDGSGYPRGLKGEEIPLAARIFAVVDVWDALLSDRPYRPAFSKDKALKYIKDQPGKHFDPQVVEAFLDMITSSPNYLDKLSEL